MAFGCRGLPLNADFFALLSVVFPHPLRVFAALSPARSGHLYGRHFSDRQLDWGSGAEFVA